MAVFGSTISFYRMPRTGSATQTHMPDLGYDLVSYILNAEEKLPGESEPIQCYIVGHHNLQTWILAFFYAFAFLRALYHPMGRLLIVRFFILDSAIFLTRTTTIAVTSQPNPNGAEFCLAAQVEEVSLRESFIEVVWGNFPPRTCGDLMFSGRKC
jgi:hypothetical protein